MKAGYKIEIRKAFRDDTTEPITFTQDTSLGKSDVLLSATLNKKMYEYSSLVVEIQTEKDTDTFRDKLVTLSNDTTTLAKDYFVFNIKQKTEKVILTAYSIDYFLSIDKFCQAFTSKTLVDGIIKPTLQKSHSTHFDRFREILTGDKQGDITNFVVNNVQNFLVKDENNEEEIVYVESKIPYAVQYNESFYDFMVRLCSRDGEFLYLGEDKRLHIGLEEKSSISLSSLRPIEKEYTESYEESNEANWVDRNYLLGSENYNGRADEKKNLNAAFGVLAPEYLEKIEIEEYSTWEDFTHPFSEVCTVLRALALERTLKDSLLTASRTMVVTFSHYDLFVLYFNTVYKRKYPKNMLLYSSGNMTAEDGKLTRDNDGYQQLYNIQEKAKNGQLTVQIAEVTDIKIGDIVTDKKHSYVVNEITIELTPNGDKTYEEDCKLVLIKKTENGFFPLPMPEKRIKKSSAQRAIVVDNFDPDRMGRVRVKYPWQDGVIKLNEDDLNKINCTPWIRVSCPMASDGAGFLFTPMLRDEVLVDYEEGNIERPYVCGAFYNHSNKPSLPSRSQTHGIVRSITSANGHHLSFIDNGGGERYIANFLPITRFAASFALADRQIFKGPYGKYFGGGFEIADYYGIYSITGNTHARSINISSPFGTVNIDAFQGINIEAPMGDINIVGKNVNIEARNNLTMTSGTNISGYFKNKENLGILVEPMAVVNKVTGVDLSFLRTYLEVILRPIGGTMLIKSNRYMRLEAGDGETVIERDRANNDFSSFLCCHHDRNVVDVLLDTVRYTLAIARNYRSMCEKWTSLSNRVKEYKDTAIREIGEGIVTELGVLTQDELENRYYTLSSDEQGLLRAMCRDANEINEIKDSLFDNYKLHDNDILSKIESFDIIFKSQMKNWKADEEAPATFSTKELLYKELKYAVDSQKNLKDVVEMDKWVDGMVIDAAIRRKDDEAVNVKSVLKTVAKEATGVADFSRLSDERAWTEREKGAILISDDKRNFFKIGTDGNLQKISLRDYDRFIIDTINSIDD